MPPHQRTNTARTTNVRRRAYTLSINKRIELNKTEQFLFFLIARQIQRQHQNEPLTDFERNIIYLTLEHHYELTHTPQIERPLLQHVPRTIESFNETDCWNLFRTRKEDLHRLFQVFQIPNQVFTEELSRFAGEELFLFSLHRYAHGTTLENDSTQLFGRDGTQWTRAFHWFNTHMIQRFAHLVNNNLEYWQPHFAEFAEVIRRKIESKTGVQFPAGEFRVFGFIDDKVIKICRPGAGPNEEGENAERNDNFMQMAFYNGWKKHHGIKYQSCELPNGLCMDLYGPVSFRHNDVALVGFSQINERLEAVQEGEENLYALYGDGIFQLQTCILRGHKGDVLTARQLEENRVMKKVRISIEWDFGLTSQKFKFVHNWNLQKIRQHENVKNYYLVTTLLRNANVCLYGSQTTNYFECEPPNLEEYFV